MTDFPRVYIKILLYKLSERKDAAVPLKDTVNVLLPQLTDLRYRLLSVRLYVSSIVYDLRYRRDLHLPRRRRIP